MNPTPVIPVPSPAEGGTYWLRMTTFQAIPPVNLFAVPPTATITGDGLYLVQGAVPAIFPGPLVMPLFASQVSDAGRAQILAWADELGLLSGKTDFTGDGSLPGGITGQIELTVDGRLVALRGLPDAASPDPKPGSPEAFGELWRRIASLPQTLPGELGPEQPYTPTAYAILVGEPPAPQDGLPANIMDWPLDTPLATFGGPVANNSARCGLVEGEDAATLTPALAQANQLTKWIQDPEMSVDVRAHGPADRRRREPVRGDLRPRGLTCAPAGHGARAVPDARPPPRVRTMGLATRCPAPRRWRAPETRFRCIRPPGSRCSPPWPSCSPRAPVGPVPRPASRRRRHRRERPPPG